MSTPPSFSPEPRRRRPSAQGARPATQAHADHGDAPVERVPLEERVVSPDLKAPPSLPSSHPGSSPSTERPRIEEAPSRMEVKGVAADGAAPRQWRITEDGTEESPFEPTPTDRAIAPAPPSFAPVRRRAAAQSTSHYSQPPAYAPQSGVRSAAHGAPASASPQTPRFAPVSRPQGPPAPSRPRPISIPRRRPLRKFFGFVAVLLAVVVAWAVFLMWDANGNLGRTSALSGAPDTPGTTYLLEGSDSRADGAIQDGYEGSERSDSIILIHVAENGQAVALSIPRDTYVAIPGYGSDKINASYAYGGSELLVQTVENLTGLTVDHYAQVGMGGVASIVDAVNGVNLCYDSDVSDDFSGLTWTAGCHDVDGTTALAFSRMRYSDPRGDIGRTERQRQVISTVVSKAVSPSTLLNPMQTLRVERAGSSAFTVDHESSVVDVARLVQAFRSASNTGLMGTPPIETIDFTTDAGASAVLLEDETAPDFFAKVRTGTLTPSDLNIIAGQ